MAPNAPADSTAAPALGRLLPPAASTGPGCTHVRAVHLLAELTLLSLSVPLLIPEDFPCSKVYCLK